MKLAELEAPKRPTLTAQLSMFPIASVSGRILIPSGENVSWRVPAAGVREYELVDGVGRVGEGWIAFRGDRLNS